MIRVIIFFALLMGAGAVRAQSIERFVARLEQGDSLSEVRVQVVEHGSAAALVGQLSAGRRSDEISGYRVRIFFDNSQNARSSASAAVARFKEAFPDVPAYMSYENPYFKVMVGNCATKEEAIILKGHIEGTFDRAFISREDIPLQNLSENFGYSDHNP